jgi:secreted trypsin-like serine protease
MNWLSPYWIFFNYFSTIMLQRLILVTQFAFAIGKIVNLGVFDNTDHNRYPWLVQIALKNHTTGQSQVICGGFLLSNDTRSSVIISAAHCFVDDHSYLPLSSSDFEIVFPSINQPNRMNITNIIIHPDFSFSDKVNDIALIKTSSLTNSLREAMNQMPLLADAGYIPSSESECYHVGYGADDQLRKFPVLIDTTCSSHWLCAYEPGNRVSNGDSGSPLICFSNDNTPAIYGVVSFGANSTCKSSEYLVYYSNISLYFDWISFHSSKSHLSQSIYTIYTFLFSYPTLVYVLACIVFLLLVFGWIVSKIRFRNTNINDNNLNTKLLTSITSSSA